MVLGFLVAHKAVFFSFILCRHPLHLPENHHVVQLVRQVHHSFFTKSFEDSFEFFNEKSFEAKRVFFGSFLKL